MKITKEQVLKAINEEAEYTRDYILNHEDYASNCWHIFIDALTYDSDIIHDRIENIIGRKITYDQLGHLYHRIADNIAIRTEIGTSNDDEGYEQFYSFIIGETEHEIAGELSRKIQSLSDDDKRWVECNSDYFMTPDFKSYYLIFDHYDTMNWYVHVGDLKEELENYG